MLSPLSRISQALGHAGWMSVERIRRMSRGSRGSLPAAPAEFVEAELFGGIHWHQRWEVFDGIHLPGRNDVQTILEYVGLPDDLTGKRVLDVGAWNGGFSFECERRGASEVVSLSLEDPNTSGFSRLKTILGSKVSYVLGSVYNLDPDSLGQFDIVLFLGVLYHLRYPLLAADKLRSVTKGELLIETHVIDRCFIPAGMTSAEALLLTHISPALSKVPLWQFYRRDELGTIPATGSDPMSPRSSRALGRLGSRSASLATGALERRSVQRPRRRSTSAVRTRGKARCFNRG